MAPREPSATPSAGTPPLTLSLPEIRLRVQDFLREYLRNRSPETVGTYRRSLNEFERWFVLRGGSFRFTAEDVLAYKEYLGEERGLHEVSVSTYLTALRRFCQYLVDIGLLGENPARGVKGNRRPASHSRKVLTQEEVDRLVETLATGSEIERRDRAVVFLMLFGGLSEIEIVRADVQDLEQTLMGWYLRVQGKGRTTKDQQVPVDPPVMDAIRLYLDSRGRIRPEDPLFVSHGHRSEGERLNTRSLRSRVNANLRASGIKRKRMRHGTLDTTLIYTRIRDLLNGDPAA